MDKFTKGLICFIALTITSTIYSSVYLSTVDSTSDNKSDKCPIIPRKDTYKINKVVTARWQWTYLRGKYKVKCRCISINHDADVFYKDKLVARTDAKTLSFTSETPILDCKNKQMVMMNTGDAEKTLINQNNIKVSYLFRSNDGEIIAYSDAKHFITDNIKIKDIEGETIANLKRNKLSTKWAWTIDVINQNHTMSDPAILLAIAGKRSFSENKGKADTCNIIFWLFFIIFLVCWFIIFSILGILLYDYCGSRKKQSVRKVKPFALTVINDGMYGKEELSMRESI